MTDFRALCAELVAELEAWESADDEFSSGGTVRSDADYELAPRARAALAQPEPPSLKEQALAILTGAAVYELHGGATTDNRLSAEDMNIIRRALEQLDD
jgi:hypothetical protein